MINTHMPISQLLQPRTCGHFIHVPTQFSCQRGLFEATSLMSVHKYFFSFIISNKESHFKAQPKYHYLI